MNAISNFIRSIAFDLVGIGFAALAGYGMMSGHLSAGDEQTALAVAALYLGVKMPVGPGG